MKRVFRQFITAILLLSAFSFRCLGEDTYTLELNLEKGKIYTENLFSELNMTMNAMGNETSIDMLSEMTINFEVIDQKNDIYDVRVSYQRIKINTTVPGTLAPVSIDSDFPENDTHKKLGDVFKSLVGIPIDVQLTRLGKVKSVDGTDRLVECFDVLTNEQLRQMFSQQFSESAFRTSLQHLTAYYPEKPVAVNESWDVTMNYNSFGVDLVDKMHLTLIQVQDDIAILEDVGSIISPEGTDMHIQGIEAHVLANGEQTGIIHLDMKTGWVVRSEINLKYKENIKLMGHEIVENFIVKSITTGK